MSFPAKTPFEQKILTFNFETEAPESSTLSNPVFEVVVTKQNAGATAQASDITLTSTLIVGRKVLVLAAGGLDAAIYRVTCKVSGSNGEKHQIDKDFPISVKAALVS